ncbi:MAG: M50 family metallopeptidase, partial [Planctomycetaceae bacterium]
MKGRPIDRVHQAVLIASLLPLSWLGMMAVHEFGHVLGAWATGGTVTEVVLHPLAISRTDVRPNPRPLIVVWAGPLIGTLLPAAALAAAVLVRLPGAFLLRFFAGFCLIANGAYIGVGSLSGTGDAGVMLRHGSPPWALWLFGLAAVAAG